MHYGNYNDIGSYPKARVSITHHDTLRNAFGGRSPRAIGNFAAHQNANLVDLLPLVLETELGADFEIAGGNVDGARDLAPIIEIVHDFPVHVAVVHDEQVASGLTGSVGDGGIWGWEGCHPPRFGMIIGDCWVRSNGVRL
jgi:hypothetical protein